jgi:hypothetical protein
MGPLAREEQLVVQEIGDETVIYDERRDHVLRLNRTAALVWRLCDGRRTATELAEAVGRALAAGPGAPAAVTEEVVWLALDRLEKAHLLQGGLARPAGAGPVTRRDVLRKAALIGGMSVLIPVVQSMVAPTPAMAASIGCAKRGQTFDYPLRPCCPGTVPGPRGKCVDRAGNP